VNLDERESSWHPKLALAKQYAEDNKATQWRLWIGSRNLTRDLSWDIGLALVGQPGGQGDVVSGISDLGYEVAQRGNLSGVSPAKVKAELRTVRWAVPHGTKVQSIRLLQGSTERDLPIAPTQLRKLIVVSPFLDGSIVKRLANWGDAKTHRLLVSTRAE